MKRVTFFILWLWGASFLYSAFAQSRTVIVNSNQVERSVITMDSTSNNVSIWEQLEMERVAAEKAKQDRIEAQKKAEEERLAALKKAEEERIAAEKAEQLRKAAELAEQQRLEEEKRAEQQRLEDEKRAEQQRLEDEKRAEQQRIDAEKAEQKRIADSISAVQRAEVAAVKAAHHDSIKNERKERIAAYPWTNMILLNGAFALYPEYGFGLTYARVKQGGYYISIMASPSIRFSADYKANSQGEISDITPFYSGKKASTRWSATVGGLVRMRIPLYFYGGIGYGYRGVFYETSEKEWVAWRTKNAVYHGMHWEAGLVGNIKGFGLSLGVSSITNFTNIYWEGKLGLGYCF